jgi:hypothetical protein
MAACWGFVGIDQDGIPNMNFDKHTILKNCHTIPLLQ